MTSLLSVRHRESARYRTQGRVDIVQGHKRCASGELIDISATGASFWTFMKLSIGGNYTMTSSEFGVIPCTVVRGFNGGFGIRFNHSIDARMRLAKNLEDKFV